MEVIHERVAGLDVHKDSVVACVRIVSEGKAKRHRTSVHPREVRGGAADRAPGQRGQDRRDPLVPIDRIAGFDSGGQLLVRDNDHFGDRPQHEPLSDRRPSHRLGGAVSRTERERGQTQTLPPAQWRALVEDHARSMHLGRQAAEDSYYRAQFYRLQARRAVRRKSSAVAASILTAIYHILKDVPTKTSAARSEG